MIYNKIKKLFKKKEINSFDKIYLNYFSNQKIIVFDVGANFGQSINRFDNLLNISKYYSFEPLEECYNFLLKKYNDKKFYHINNALGIKEESKLFYVNNKKANSSFHELNTNSKWWQSKKDRYKNHNIAEKRNISLTSLDNFLKNNYVTNIDILKIDTQNHEDEVLLGSNETLKQKKINFIELEINVGNGYLKSLSFFDIESILNNYNYSLYGINNKGNLLENSNLQFDVLYKLNE